MKGKMFRIFMFTAAAAVLFSSFSELPLAAEAIFLKDGSIAEGSIVTDAADSITIRTADKKLKRIKRGTIMRVLYTKLKLGKIYIQKRDGESIVAYMVDENQDSYTFRKDLYKTAEFVLSRSDVLFIAEKNPSGLKVDGEAGTDRVTLTWLPPYDAVKKYNVYVTKDKAGRYGIADSTSGKSITLKNLSSNTTYYILVTSVDNDNYESSPSNEIKITTKNKLPSRPAVISSEKTGSGDRIIKWQPSADEDGKVEKYRIYGKADGKREIIAEVKQTEYTVKNASRYSRIDVAAVDDRGDESEEPKVLPVKGGTVIRLNPGVIFPLGKFGEMFSAGYGGELGIYEQNLFFSNFEMGLNSGFYYLDGKDLLDKKNRDYGRMLFVPVYLSAGYEFFVTESFIIKPLVSFGGVYMNMKYEDRNMTAAQGRDKQVKTSEAAFKGGLTLEYRFTENISVSTRGEYGSVIEKNGRLNFIMLNAGVGYTF